MAIIAQRPREKKQKYTLVRLKYLMCIGIM